MTQSDIHLEWQVKQIIADGGEGVILRKVGSRYEPGRTSSLYKLKVSIPASHTSVFTLSAQLSTNVSSLIDTLR